jgi:hypothetical protein
MLGAKPQHIVPEPTSDQCAAKAVITETTHRIDSGREALYPFDPVCPPISLDNTFIKHANSKN